MIDNWYDNIPDEEIKSYLEDCEADDYLSSEEYHDSKYIDCMV